MSVESKIQELLEGNTEDQEQLKEAEHMAKAPQDLSAMSVGNVGKKTSASMKQDTSKAGQAANKGDTNVLPNLGNSPKPTMDEFDEDEKNPGAKAAAKVIYAKNPASIKMKGDAKTAQIPGVTAKSGVASMTMQASEEVEKDQENVEDKDQEDLIEVDITEELNSIFGEDQSAEFKQKATSIFEAAVIARVNNEMERVVSQLEEQNTTQLEEYKEALVDKVDSYMNYVVEQWMTENQIAVENGLRTEITEQFMSGLKSLFQESYIDVPEDKLDVLDELANKVESLFEGVTEGLADTEKEKLVKLCEGVDFEDEESFAEKVSVIKENYFPKDKVKSAEQTLVEETGTGEPEQEVSDKMQAYMSSISRSKK
jgi:hypothetical protein